jgi:hypothetical protein
MAIKAYPDLLQMSALPMQEVMPPRRRRRASIVHHRPLLSEFLHLINYLEAYGNVLCCVI